MPENDKPSVPGENLTRTLATRVLQVVAVISILLSANHIFNLGFFAGITLLESQYLYVLLTLLLPPIFVAFRQRAHMPACLHVVNWTLAALTFACGIFFAWNAERIVDEGWEYGAPAYAAYVSLLFWALVMEGARRAGGWPIFIVVLIISLYPTYAGSLPGPIAAPSTAIDLVAIFHAMSAESILGIPMRAFAGLVIGFLMFGVALQHTGGGKFFIDLAFALLGHVRGGPAKVSIFSSGLMGSMSGSVITNVLTTGVLSIPAMRRVGFSRTYAAGVETCASTGGVLMPPVMGATAFIMATFLEVPYVEIAIAAIIPSLLYFFGLFVQIDCYAARLELKGLPREELPSLRETLRNGWHYIAVFALLVWMLVYLNREALAPFYATALLIVINQFLPAHRWRWADLLEFLRGVGALFVELTALLAGIGLIIGALAVTGLSGTIANDLIHLAGGAPLALLAMGALTSFILGIGMTVTAAYIFLAIALAPALTSLGLDPMAIHMFILYWGMLSFITPPVALGAFAAASVAKAKPMETGFMAMRLGSIIYFIPFFFVMEPALLMQGSAIEIVWVLVNALAGIVLLSAGLQGYLPFVGSLGVGAGLELPIRIALGVGGLLLAAPEGQFLPLSDLAMAGLAALLCVPAVAATLMLRQRQTG